MNWRRETSVARCISYNFHNKDNNDILAGRDGQKMEIVGYSKGEKNRLNRFVLRAPFVGVSPPVSGIKHKNINSPPVLGILLNQVQVQYSLIVKPFLQYHQQRSPRKLDRCPEILQTS